MTQSIDLEILNKLHKITEDIGEIKTDEFKVKLFEVWIKICQVKYVKNKAYLARKSIAFS